MKKAMKRGLSLLFVVAFLVSAMSIPVSAAKRVSVTKKAVASQKVSASQANQNYKNFSTPYRCNIATALDMNGLLDAYAHGKEPGTDIGIWEANWGDAQDFTLERPKDKKYANKGWYLIKSTASGLCVDLEYGSAEDGANVALYSQNGGINQLWKFIPTSSGYLIQNCVGTYLTADTLADGYFTNVYCSKYTGESNQRWYLNRFNGETTNSWIEFDTPTVLGNKATINFRYRVHHNNAVIIGVDASDKSRWDFTFSNGNYVWKDSTVYGSATLTAISKTSMIRESESQVFRLVAQDVADEGIDSYWIAESARIDLKT